jgi:hypothetical protein
MIYRGELHVNAQSIAVFLERVAIKLLSVSTVKSLGTPNL